MARSRRGWRDAPTGGNTPKPALDAAVVDFEAPVFEAAPKERPLIDGVGRGPAQGRFRQELCVDRVNPVIERVDNGQRAPPALLAASQGIEALLLALGFDLVEVGEVFERDRGPLVLGEQRVVKLAADVGLILRSG